MGSLLIENARVVTPGAVLDPGYVVVSGSSIEEVGLYDTVESDRRTRVPSVTDRIDANGRWLLPGLIDLHNDGIEREVEPRPNAVFPLEIALVGLENRLLSHGVTSIYHCLAFMDGRGGVSRAERIDSAVEHVARLESSLTIRHRIHARYEITETHYAETVSALADGGKVQLVSVMDHTPGQGQYRDLEHLKTYYQQKLDMGAVAVAQRIQERIDRAQAVDTEPSIDRVVDAARANGVPVASHDDDSVEKVLRMREKGVTISEFPVELVAAEAAAQHDLHVVVGAPNVLLGKSNSGNMRAIDAVRSGAAHALCSDYYSPSMLHAVFRLMDIMPAHQAVGMATIGPARAAGIDSELGSIETGKRADLILVSEHFDRPEVRLAIVDGAIVYRKGARSER